MTTQAVYTRCKACTGFHECSDLAGIQADFPGTLRPDYQLVCLTTYIWSASGLRGGEWGGAICGVHDGSVHTWPAAWCNS
jgi:hypothetical protein